MSETFLHDMTASEDTAKQFLRAMNVIRSVPPKCAICNTNMSNVKQGRGELKIWRCPRHKSEKCSEQKGSYFEHSRLCYVKIVQLLYSWANKDGVQRTVEHTGLASETVVQWFQYIHDICSHYLTNNRFQIGGPGHII